VTEFGVARWYIDADTLGLAHVLIRARHDVTFPGDHGMRHTSRWTLPPCPVQQTSAHGTEWIPGGVAAAGTAPLVASAIRPDSRLRYPLV